MNEPALWIGVDLDGTLAEYNGWEGLNHIGQPIERMQKRVLAWLAEGIDVRIITARVAHDPSGFARYYVMKWCEQYLGRPLVVTCSKDFNMLELWDDRAIQVDRNTGIRADGEE